MKSMRLMLNILTFALVAFIVPFELAAQNQTRYRVIDVGTLPGGTFSNARGINNKGEVVGSATLANDTEEHAFLWRKGVITDLGTLAPADSRPISFAFWINDNDEIVGMSETSDSDPLGEDVCGGSNLICLPVVWRDGTINALPTLGGNNGQAHGINNRGQIVGISETAEEDPTCFAPQILVMKPTVWVNGQPSALSTAPFLEGIVGEGPGPDGNNDKGQIVGNAFPCDFSVPGNAYLWYKDQAINMGTVDGFAIAPVSINNQAQATGVYTTDTNLNRGFIWQDGVATDIGALPGHPQVFGNSINDKGQITGLTCDLNLTESSCTSFVWQNGVMTDLNAVVPSDTSLFMWVPNGINSAGEIVGAAFLITPNGFFCCHGFLAIPDDRAVGNGTTEQAKTREAQTIIIPANLRSMLRRELGRHIRGLGVPK